MSDSKSAQDESRDDVTVATEERRGFFGSFAAIAAASIGALLGVGPVAVGMYAVIMDPLRKKSAPQKALRSRSYKEGYYYVAELNELDTQIPRRFKIVANVIDAWNFIENQPIGSVYLRREGDQVECFHTTCPHAGCAVSFEEDSQAYLCPCHNSTFKMDGSKLESDGSLNPSPRDLDTLQVELQGESVYVKYEDYFTGRHDKIAK